MRFSPLSRALALAALTGLSTYSQAVVIDWARVRQMTASQNTTYFRALAEAARGAEGSGAKADRDRRTPRLRKFVMLAPADVAAPYAQLVVELAATDDLSGVSDWVFEIDGPSGQSKQVSSRNEGLPALHFSNETAVDVTSYVEPGVWKLNFLFVSDYEGNVAYYNPDLLKGIGDSQVTFVNSRPNEADTQPPGLKAGTMLTSVVKISGRPKGTKYASQLIASDFEVSDDRSGLHVADAEWCLHDHTRCVDMNAQDDRRGVTDGVLHTLGYLDGNETPGDYFLYFLHLVDQAGNDVYLVSKDMGGEFDFDPFMPGGHVMTLKP
jgi:hypothetical protein